MATLGLRQIGRGLDLGLFTVTALLTLIGLGALFSFSLNAPEVRFTYLERQAIAVAIGIACTVLLMRLDYRFLGGIHWVLYGAGIISLLAVRFFGQTVRGTTGWFEIAGFQLQPVEFVKVIMCIVLAKFFADHANQFTSWRVIALSGGIVGLPIILIMLQPDLGSAIILLGLWFGLLAALPIPRRRLGVLLLAAVVLGVASWFVILRPYQKERLLNFVTPGRDRLGSGYNVQQAMTAIGSGQIVGRGLGLGPLSQLNFLPERHTDFIFASMSEELGFLGSSAVIILFALFLWRFLRLSHQSRDGFSLILSLSFGLMFFIQVAINLGMNMGIFPVTGIPLPFVSYGGSSLIASFMAIGIAESLAARQRTLPL